MSKRLLLDVSPTGVRHEVEIDSDGDELTLIEHTPTLVEREILDGNARLRTLHQRKGAQLQHAARIPINTYNQWRKEWMAGPCKTISWAQFEVSKLNSRDNCNLRTGISTGAFGKRL